MFAVWDLQHCPQEGGHHHSCPITVTIDSDYSMIPEDSDASILTAGLLGSQYIGLQAGGSEFYLEDGSEIMFTQSAIVLEQLIGKYLFNAGGDDGDD